MESEIIDDELQEMYEEPKKEMKVLCSDAIKSPLREMRLNPPVTVESGTAVMEAIRMMRDLQIGCVMVLRKGNLIGAFTERDALMKLIGMKDLDKVKVDDVMTPNPEYLHEDDMTIFALNLMSVGGCCHVPVVDAEKRPVGVLSLKNIVEFLADCFPQEILNLPPKPIRITREREGA